MVSPLLLRAPGILRAAGCEVVEFAGWQDRGRPYPFGPIGLTIHHDGSPVGPAQPAEAYARWLFTVGRGSEGIPAPLSQFWIDYYGRWWIGAAGRANHALGATGWGAIRPKLANQLTAGVEMDNTTGEPTTSDQWEALHRGVPALFAAYGWDPLTALAGHLEVDAGRKSDPDDIAMPQLRRDVFDLMRDPVAPPAPPAAPEPEDDEMGSRSDLGYLEPGESETYVVVTPNSPDLGIGPVWLSMTRADGNNQAPDDDAAKVQGKQFRPGTMGDGAGGSVPWATGLFGGSDSWGPVETVVPPRLRTSTELVAGCHTVLVENIGSVRLRLQLEIGSVRR